VIRIAIIAAMPGELKPLVRGWKFSTHETVKLWSYEAGGDQYIAACAGAGQAAATRAFTAIERDGPINIVFSVGWAGALCADLAMGSAYNVGGVIDIRTGERFSCDAGAGEIWLTTSPRVADASEKERLAATYGAGLVDMEAAAVARLADMRGIPFYCIKGISDGFRDKLPDFNSFIAPDGRFRTARFAFYALFTPWYWPGLVRMGENSRKASQSIAESLIDFLDERGHIRERNGYPNFKF
jgi:adenosylhomocysteine nucleosidase